MVLWVLVVGSEVLEVPVPREGCASIHPQPLVVPAAGALWFLGELELPPALPRHLFLVLDMVVSLVGLVGLLLSVLLVLRKVGFLVLTR